MGEGKGFRESCTVLVEGFVLRCRGDVDGEVRCPPRDIYVGVETLNLIFGFDEISQASEHPVYVGLVWSVVVTVPWAVWANPAIYLEGILPIVPSVKVFPGQDRQGYVLH